jgi:hypothetical protein
MVAERDRDSTPRNVLIPSDWSEFSEATHILAAVRVGETIRLTGHTGETPDGAFSETLKRRSDRPFAISP